MKTALLISIIVLCTSTANVLITRGMKQAGEVSSLRFKILSALFQRVLKNSNYLISIALMTFSFFLFLAILSWSDVSLIIPATSMEFVLSTLGAKFILKEEITARRWAGTCFVCLGVALISLP